MYMSISQNKQYAQKHSAHVNTIYVSSNMHYAEMNMLPQTLGHKHYVQTDYTQTQAILNYNFYWIEH